MRLRLILTLLISVFSVRFAVCQNVVGMQQLADEHIKNGNNELAASLYLRIMYFDTTANLADMCNKIAHCFFNAGNYPSALRYFNQVQLLATNDSTRVDAIINSSALELKLGRPDIAMVNLLSIDDSSAFDKERMHFYIGLAAFNLDDYVQSETNFKEALKHCKTTIRDSVDLFFAALDALQRRYNPVVARYMSLFVPGSGQFYCGHYTEGINSLLLTTTFFMMFGYVAVRYTMYDSFVLAFPWYQRYYTGGYMQAERLTEMKRNDEKRMVLNKLLQFMALQSKGSS